MAVSFRPHQATMGPNVFILNSRERPQLSTAAQASFPRADVSLPPLVSRMSPPPPPQANRVSGLLYLRKSSRIRGRSLVD